MVKSNTEGYPGLGTGGNTSYVTSDYSPGVPNKTNLYSLYNV
jgi:hypothetical protein